MFVSQLLWTDKKGWQSVNNVTHSSPQLILYFGTRQVLESGERYHELRHIYPSATILGATSGGEILNDQLFDHTVVASLITFDKTTIRVVQENIDHPDASLDVGQAIATALLQPDLAGLFVLSDGLGVNGSALIRGMRQVVGQGIPITGGLASDGELFESTFVGVNEPPKPGCVAAIGFYGKSIHIGHGSFGGWDTFGPQRVITKSQGNILYELDGKPALTLYKSYLGEEADQLPGSALLFPLAIRAQIDTPHHLVRTVLAINEDDQSMTFAGDVPEGYVAQLMYGNFDRLVEGATESARQATTITAPPQLGVLISCIGRRLLMGQHISDELEAVYNFWNHKVPLSGFYSYGEISPHNDSGICELHNQTMTITTFSEH